MIEVLVDALMAIQLSNAVFATQPIQNDPNLVFG